MLLDWIKKFKNRLIFLPLIVLFRCSFDGSIWSFHCRRSPSAQIDWGMRPLLLVLHSMYILLTCNTHNTLHTLLQKCILAGTGLEKPVFNFCFFVCTFVTFEKTLYNFVHGFFMENSVGLEKPGLISRISVYFVWVLFYFWKKLFFQLIRNLCRLLHGI